MLIKKKPYQFWNFRDLRKKKFPELKSSELPEVPCTGKTVKGFISHHILLPRKELPQALIGKFRIDLTLRSPEFDKALKYGKGFVSYAVPEFVHLYSMDTEYMGLPRSVRLPYIHKQFAKCGVTLELEDIRPQFETIPFKQKEDVKPYFFQEDAIKSILDGNVVIQLKCGRGKTILALMAVAQIRMRTLILVRTNILLNQWLEAIKKIFDIQDKDIGIINGKIKKEGLITVATEQSISSMPRDDKKRIGNTYGHVMLDECHGYNTHVMIDYNKSIPIGDIYYDKNITHVLSYNLKNKRIEKRRIIKKMEKTLTGKKYDLWIINSEGKKVYLKPTPNHKYYVVGKGYIRVDELKKGDKLI
jgi:hypothetical protein